MSSSEDHPTGDQSLEDVEDDRWGDPPSDATSLVRRAHELRRRPVGSLDVEDLRLLVSQRVGLETLVPLALVRLREEPLAEGDYYPGDLLAAVLRLPTTHWRSHPDQHALVSALVPTVDRDDPDFPSATDLGELLDEFA